MLSCHMPMAPGALGPLSFEPPSHLCCVCSAEMSLSFGTALEEGGGQDHPTGHALFWAMTVPVELHGGMSGHRSRLCGANEILQAAESRAMARPVRN